MSIKSLNANINRRNLMKLGLLGGVAIGGLPPLARIATAQDLPSIELEKVSVRWGSLPSTNQAWVVLGSQKGFLEDVGISMANGVPKIVQEPQAIAQVNNDELDICGHYFGGIIQALNRVDNIRPFFCYSYFQGRTILSPPDAGIKSVEEFLNEGMSWSEAANAAMAQIKGQQFAIMNAPSVLPWINLALEQGGLKLEDTEAIPLEDPRVVQLALSGQVNFASPAGAVQIYQLQHQAGWKSLIDMPLMVESMPEGKAALSDFLHYDLIMCTEDYLNGNTETIYRATTAMFRTLDYMFGPDRMTAYAEYAPFINAANGSNLDAVAIRYIFDVMDPFFPFSDQEVIWENADSPLYYKNIYEPQIQRLIENGTLPDRTYDLDKMFVAKSIFEDLRDMKKSSEAILAKVDDSLEGEKRAIVEAAVQHFKNFNYYDSDRLLRSVHG